MTKTRAGVLLFNDQPSSRAAVLERVSSAGSMGGASARSLLPGSARGSGGSSLPGTLPSAPLSQRGFPDCRHRVLGVRSGSVPWIQSTFQREKMCPVTYWGSWWVWGWHGECWAGKAGALLASSLICASSSPKQPRLMGLPFWAFSSIKWVWNCITSPVWWRWEVGFLET